MIIDMIISMLPELLSLGLLHLVFGLNKMPGTDESGSGKAEVGNIWGA